MIKKFASVVLVAGSLTACSALKSLGVDQATIDSIQTASVAACGFLPTVETVVDLVSGGIGTVPGAVANVICKAVIAQPAAAGRPTAAAPANVNGIPVSGKFVR